MFMELLSVLKTIRVVVEIQPDNTRYVQGIIPGSFQKFRLPDKERE